MNATPQAAKHLLEFDAERHVYYVDGEAKMSTTQILKASGVVDDRWYNEEVRWRGSEVHAVTAARDKSENPPVMQKFMPYVLAWEHFKVERKFKPVMVEKQLYDESLDTCGTLDRLGCFEDGKIDVIIDLKTSESGNIPKWVALQTASYGHALDPKALWRRMAVILMPDATFRVEPYPIDTYLKDVAAFQTLVQSLRVRKEYGN